MGRKRKELIKMKRGTLPDADMEGLNRILSEIKEAREKAIDRVVPAIG